MLFKLNENAYLPIVLDEDSPEEKRREPQSLDTLKESFINWGFSNLLGTDLESYQKRESADISEAFTKFFDKLKARSLGGTLEEKHYLEMHIALDDIIASLNNNQNIPIQQKRLIYINLAHQLGACPPGIYTSVQSLRLRLHSQDGAQYWLANQRQEFIEQIANEIVQKFYNGGFAMFPHILEACLDFSKEIKFSTLQQSSGMTDVYRDDVKNKVEIKEYFQSRCAQLYQFEAIIQRLTLELTMQVYDLIASFKKAPKKCLDLQESLSSILNKIASSEEELPCFALELIDEDEVKRESAENILSSADEIKIRVLSRAEFQEQLRPYLIQFLVKQDYVIPPLPQLEKIALFPSGIKDEQSSEQYIFETYDYLSENSWLRSKSGELVPLKLRPTQIKLLPAEVQLKLAHLDLSNELNLIKRDYEALIPEQLFSWSFLIKEIAKLLFSPLLSLLMGAVIIGINCLTLYGILKALDNKFNANRELGSKIAGRIGLGVGALIGIAGIFVIAAIYVAVSLVATPVKFIYNLYSHISNSCQLAQLNTKRIQPIETIKKNLDSLLVQNRQNQDNSAFARTIQIQAKLLNSPCNSKDPRLEQRLNLTLTKINDFIRLIVNSNTRSHHNSSQTQESSERLSYHRAPADFKLSNNRSVLLPPPIESEAAKSPNQPLYQEHNQESPHHGL